MLGRRMEGRTRAPARTRHMGTKRQPRGLRGNSVRLFRNATRYPGRNPGKRIATYARYPRYPQARCLIFRFARLGFVVQVQFVIGTEVPASSEGRQRKEDAAGDERTDLHRMAMRRASAQVGPTGRGAGRVSLPDAVRGSPWGQATRKGLIQEGPQKVSEPALGQDQKLEATPDLVSQDRVADGLRDIRLANTGRS